MINIFNDAYVIWQNQNYWTVSGRIGAYKDYKQTFEFQTK